MRFELEFAGEHQVSRTLLRFHDRAANCRPVFDRMADRIADLTRRNFDAEGASEGQKWADLSPKYAAWKRRRWPGRKILVRTGALERDLTRRPFGVEQITAHSMRIGTSLPYAKHHQQGAGNLPRRRPFELSAASRDELTKMLQRYLRNGEL